MAIYYYTLIRLADKLPIKDKKALGDFAADGDVLDWITANDPDYSASGPNATEVLLRRAYIAEAGDRGFATAEAVGSSADAPAAAGGTGTLSAKLRLITQQIASLLSGVGAHGNAWSQASVEAGGTSNPVDTQNAPFISVFGSTTTPGTLTLQRSQDGTNWHDSQMLTLAAAGDFFIDAISAARFHRLKSSTAATITATIAAKG